MTLQSLEPYQDEEDVKEVIDKGVEFLADIQDDDGGYTAFGAKSSESISQTVIALSAVGVDCNEDERFQKDGKGLYDTLMTFYQKDGSFKHTLTGKATPWQQTRDSVHWWLTSATRIRKTAFLI